MTVTFEERRAMWLRQGLCPYCGEHGQLYTVSYCYECAMKRRKQNRLRYKREREKRGLEPNIDKLLRGISVDGDWPRNVYFAELATYRCDGTRFNVILTALEHGEPVKAIAERYNCDERTVKVYRKVLRGTISGVMK